MVSGWATVVSYLSTICGVFRHKRTKGRAMWIPKHRHTKSKAFVLRRSKQRQITIWVTTFSAVYVRTRVLTWRKHVSWMLGPSVTCRSGCSYDRDWVYLWKLSRCQPGSSVSAVESVDASAWTNQHWRRLQKRFVFISTVKLRRATFVKLLMAWQ